MSRSISRGNGNNFNSFMVMQQNDAGRFPTAQSQSVYPQRLHRDESYNDYGFVPDPSNDNSLALPSQEVKIRTYVVVIDS